MAGNGALFKALWVGIAGNDTLCSHASLYPSL